MCKSICMFFVSPTAPMQASTSRYGVTDGVDATLAGVRPATECDAVTESDSTADNDVAVAELVTLALGNTTTVSDGDVAEVADGDSTSTMVEVAVDAGEAVCEFADDVDGDGRREGDQLVAAVCDGKLENEPVADAVKVAEDVNVVEAVIEDDAAAVGVTLGVGDGGCHCTKPAVLGSSLSPIILVSL
jgi:hypothetical protein